MLNKKTRDAIQIALDIIFEKAKARLLGRKSKNAIYINLVRNFGLNDSIEGKAREAAGMVSGNPNAPSEDNLDTQADETSIFIDTLKNRTTSKVIDAVKAGNKEILKDIFDKTTNHLETIVAEELNRAKGLGIVDTIDKISASQDIEDPTIFFIGPLDGLTCKWCKACYHCSSNQMIPRVWKRSQLSTAYFNRKTWDESTVHLNCHPNCRHSISILTPGFGFDQNGKLQFISLGWSEYDAQKARGDAT